MVLLRAAFSIHSDLLRKFWGAISPTFGCEKTSRLGCSCTRSGRRASRPLSALSCAGPRQETASAQRLTYAEKVPLTVPKPSRQFTDSALAWVIPGDFSDTVHRLETRKVILLEYHAARAQGFDRRPEVCDLPCHLCVGTRGSPAGKSSPLRPWHPPDPGQIPLLRIPWLTLAWRNLEGGNQFP